MKEETLICVISRMSGGFNFGGGTSFGGGFFGGGSTFSGNFNFGAPTTTRAASGGFRFGGAAPPSVSKASGTPTQAAARAAPSTSSLDCANAENFKFYALSEYKQAYQEGRLNEIRVL